MLNDRPAPRGSHSEVADPTPELVSLVALDGRDQSTLLALAASVATTLDLPLAAALIEAARQGDIQLRRVERVHHVTDLGVVAFVAEHAVVLGEAPFLRALGVSLENLGGWPERLRQRGERVVFLAVDGRAAGLLGLVGTGCSRTICTQIQRRTR